MRGRLVGSREFILHRLPAEQQRLAESCQLLDLLDRERQPVLQVRIERDRVAGLAVEQLLARGETVAAAELAGGFGPPDAAPLASQIERSFALRAQSLPAPTQKMLLTAAAEPVGDVTLLIRATQLLDLPMSATACASK